MGVDRITRLTVKGMRSLADVDLVIANGPQVLIGANGSGKSTIVEALELLRKASRPGLFVDDTVDGVHGGLNSLLRQGAGTLELGVEIAGGDGPAMRYGIALGPLGAGSVLLREGLDAYERGPESGPLHVIARDRVRARVYDQAGPALPLQEA